MDFVNNVVIEGFVSAIAVSLQCDPELRSGAQVKLCLFFFGILRRVGSWNEMTQDVSRP